MCVCLLLCALSASATAATLPAGFERQEVATGFDLPVGVAWAADGRMFLVEKAGVLKVVQGGTTKTVLDLSPQVNSFQDRGLLGVALDKDFASNGQIYLIYTVENDPLVPDNSGRTISRLVRLTVDANSNVTQQPTTIVGTYAPPTNAFYCPQPHSNDVDCIPADHYWHTIGTVRVDPVDGSIWFGSGDATDTGLHEQAFRTYDENTYSGKLVHVDRQGRGFGTHPFCPTETDTTKVCTKLYAKGFRQPFRFTLRDGGKGPVVGDVGWASKEEIDLTVAGKNYGWPCYQGTNKPSFYWETQTCQNLYSQENTASAATGPSLEYNHTSNGGSVTGGPIYTGTNYPAEYRGRVYFADYANNWIRSAPVNANDTIGTATDFVTDAGYPVDLQVGPDGNLVYVDIGFGAVYKIVHTQGNRAPIAGGSATPTSGAAPLQVAFSSSGSSDPDGDTLTYSWDFGDGSSSTQANPTHTYTTVGNFTATLTVSDGGRTATRTFPITTANSAPQASPTVPATYRDGTPVSLSATATDAQDGTITDDARFSWQVVLFHNTHQHPITTLTGRNVQFTPVTDHDDDSHYEVTLTVTDSGGLTDVETRRLDPQTIQLTLASTPTGAPMTYAEEAGSAPYTATTAIGFKPLMSAAASFDKDGKTYTFESWSDGGPRVRNPYTVPATNTTLTALYNGKPTASATRTPGTGARPLTVTFDGRNSVDPDGDTLTYSWDWGDGTTSGSGAQPTHQYTTAGTFTPKLTVSDGRPGGTSAVFNLPAVTVDGPPSASISSPTATARWRGGVAIPMSGSASDTVDGPLSGTALQWRVRELVGTGAPVQVHSASGTSASFTPPTNRDADTRYEVVLTATDSVGNTDTQTRMLAPDERSVTIASVPSGAPVTYGSLPAAATPFTRQSPIGYRPTVTAPDTFTRLGETYKFLSWSDGGARSHTYTVPTANSTLTANYNGLPTADFTATPASGMGPLEVAFDGRSSRDPDGTLSYLWQFGDGTTATGPTPTHTYAVGRYTFRLIVTDSNGATAAKFGGIIADNPPPTATIDAPTGGALFEAGQRIEPSGRGSDAQGPTTLDWTVKLHRGGVTTTVPMSGGGFTVPSDVTPDSWYSIDLRATDSDGAVDTDTVRIDPRTSNLRLDSEPAGAPLTLNGAAVSAPSSTLAVVGTSATVSAPASFDRDGGRWLFSQWSDGAGREHAVTVASGDPLLVARFGLQQPPPPETPRDPDPDPPAPAPPAPGPQPPRPDPPVRDPDPLPQLRVSSRGMRLSRKGRASFKLVNKAGSVWRGDVVLATTSKVRTAGRSRLRRLTFGRGSVVLAGGSRRTVGIQLSAANRKRVARLRRVRVSITLAPRGGTPFKAGDTILLPPRR